MIAVLLLLALPVQSAPTYVISGTVVHGITGRPLNKVYVSISRSEDRNKTVSVVTGADGRFRFTGVTEGKYLLNADRLGFAPQNFAQRGLYHRYTSSVVTGEHKVSEDLVFRMIPGAVLTGFVTDAQGEPLSGMMVAALRVVGAGEQRRVEHVFTGSTDDRGYYRIYALPAGQFLLAFSGRNGEGQRLPNLESVACPTTYYPGETSAQKAGSIRLEAGKESRADVVVRQVPAAALTGQVTGDNSKRQLAVSLTVPGPLGSEIPFGTAQYIYGNNFRLEHVPAGTYFLNLWEDMIRLVGRRSIDVSGSEQNVSIGETALPQISATVELRGTPRNSVAPTIVSFVQTGATLAYNRSVDKNGKIAPFPVHPGHYQIQVSKDRQLAILQASAQGAPLPAGTLDVPETGQVDVALVVNAGSAEIQGLVVRGTETQSGILVMLVPEKQWDNLTAYRFDQSDSDGTFTWYGVPPGDYLMFALEEGEPGDYMNPEAVRKLLPQSLPLSVTDAAQQSVRLQLPALKALTAKP